MGVVAPDRVETGRRAAPRWMRVGTAAEVLLIYAGILMDIWRWQITHPRAWIALLAAIIATHIAHRDRLRDLGLGLAGFKGSASLILPIALAAYLPLTIEAFARHRLAFDPFSRPAAIYFLSYGAWCAVQQYLAQSYFHRRLTVLVMRRHLRCALVAVMFGAAHIPNPVLMPATAVAGFVFAEVFESYANIWPLAFVQAVGGLLVAATFPAGLIRNMRVGPGYYFYQIR